MITSIQCSFGACSINRAGKCTRPAWIMIGPTGACQTGLVGPDAPTQQADAGLCGACGLPIRFVDGRLHHIGVMLQHDPILAT